MCERCAGPMCVERKSPIQSPVSVCGRGALFHTQPVGNSSPSPLEGSFAYSAILYSVFFLFPAARQQNRDGENPAQGCCLPAQRRPKDLDHPDGTVPVIERVFSFTFMKFGTDLKGKQQK